jgi:hypothetical protein
LSSDGAAFIVNPTWHAPVRCAQEERDDIGRHHLRALLMFDEVYGFLPPHPANPPTKRPLVSLMKQARAYGLE